MYAFNYVFEMLREIEYMIESMKIKKDNYAYVSCRQLEAYRDTLKGVIEKLGDCNENP